MKNTNPHRRLNRSILIITGILITITIFLFSPIPYYQKEDFGCGTNDVHCIAKGWHWKLSLFDTMYDKLFMPKVPDSARVTIVTLPTQGTWKTYTNAKYGFTLKHPREMYVWGTPENVAEENLDFIYITREERPVELTNRPYGINIAIFENTNKSSLEFAKRMNPNEAITILPANIPGIDASKIAFDFGYGYYLIGNNLELMIGTVQQTKEDEKLFDQILSTFRFD